MHGKCEHIARLDGETCGKHARWRVSRGRKHDAQLSCAIHLHNTCDRLIQMDNASVTVERV